MNRKSSFAVTSLSGRKRLLLVADNAGEVGLRSEFLRRNGYDVDFANGAAMAQAMARTHSYDIVLMAIECPALKTLAAKLQRLNPNATVACLADCSKAIPPLPCSRMLWKGEPLEYFLARVETLAATA